MKRTSSERVMLLGMIVLGALAPACGGDDGPGGGTQGSGGQGPGGGGAGGAGGAGGGEVACSPDTPIAVVERSPAGEGAVLAPGAPVTIRFACTIAQDSVTDATVFVHGSHTGRRSFSVAWATPDEATLTFDTPLLPGERVDVTLTGGIQSAAGEALRPAVWHFTVGGAPSSGAFTDAGVAVGSAAFAALGDLDRDGDLDVARASGQILLNDGSGTAFEAPSQGVSCSAFFETISLVDLEGDGDLDAICLGGFSGTSSVWLNDGAASFTQQAPQDALAGIEQLALGDLDGDGDLDAYAVTAATADADRILLNDGSGSFAVAGEGVGSTSTAGLALADLDGDGDLDAVMGNGSFDEPNALWLNDGAGTFESSGQALGAAPVREFGIDVGDVDRDGDVDVLISTIFDDPNVLWRNDGGGELGEQVTLSNLETEVVALADIDGDGDLDTVSAHHWVFVEYNQVLTNQGDGTFAPGASFGGGGQRLAIGDLDGDGILDALVDGALWLGN